MEARLCLGIFRYLGRWMTPIARGFRSWDPQCLPSQLLLLCRFRSCGRQTDLGISQSLPVLCGGGILVAVWSEVGPPQTWRGGLRHFSSRPCMIGLLKPGIGWSLIVPRIRGFPGRRDRFYSALGLPLAVRGLSGYLRRCPMRKDVSLG